MKSYKMSCFCRKVTAFILVVLLFMSLFSLVTVHAEDSDRTITLKFSYEQFFGAKQNVDYNWTYKLTGKGKFVVRSYRFRHDTDEKNGLFSMNFRVFSDKPFTAELSMSGGRAGTFSPAQVFNYKGIYYISNGVFGGLSPKYEGHVLTEIWSGFANLKVVPSKDDIPTGEEIIDSGTLDLTKDDYLDDDEKTAVYNRDLDFLTLKGDYKVKYTIEKDGNGKWNFITPDEAGILLEWTNRKDIDGAYVKVTAYGEFYEGFWASTYINTGITVSDIRRNDLSHLLRQKDMVSLAQSGLGKPSGFGFVVKYMYIQSFGTIDGQFCRGRIYKLDSDLVTDYGNADSEYDEYFPEITDGDSMPPEYEPDPDDPDPEKTEPDPDPDDDTTIITPVPKPDDPIFDSDLDLLKALSVFFDGLKSSMVLLGNFPAFIANIFGFLPSSVISLIGLSIVAVIILRFIGR